MGFRLVFWLGELIASWLSRILMYHLPVMLCTAVLFYEKMFYFKFTGTSIKKKNNVVFYEFILLHRYWSYFVTHIFKSVCESLTLLKLATTTIPFTFTP